ncbi:MAG: hypothetical protein M3209_19320 [Acidobacteriota bacterium]|nr:hypothetical protein [Acidobacteriota bacterium]
MLSRYLSLMFAVMLAVGVNGSFVFAQTQRENNTESVKTEVIKRGTNEKKRVRVKMLNGTKIKGYISQIGDNSFTLTNSKTKQPIVIAYSDVSKVESGGLAGGARIGIITGAIAGVTAIVLYVAFQNAIRDN